MAVSAPSASWGALIGEGSLAVSQPFFFWIISNYIVYFILNNNYLVYLWV